MSIRAVLGTFDGVHLGHRALFARARELSDADGLAVAAIVICRGEELITGLSEREALLRAAGADEVYFVPLERVRGLSGEEFVHHLQTELGARAAVCGYDFRFGKGRADDAKTLSVMMPTEIVPAVTVDGVKVSSTAIREALKDGRIEDAALFLGGNFRVGGRVAGGKQLGSKRGFPTANIPYPPEETEMARGVYFTRVHCEDKAYNAISNVGVCPTVEGTDTVIESHLLDFDGLLYGEDITVEFLHYLRGERRFPDIESLYGQIAADTEAAKEYFNNKREEI